SLGSCTKSFSSKAALKKHFLVDHKKVLCETCWKGRRCFAGEIEAFQSRQELTVHQRIRHPSCPACHVLFYGEDELGEHCRQQHELCHLCDRERRLHVLPNGSSNNDGDVGTRRKKTTPAPIDERRKTERERHVHATSLRTAPYFMDYEALEAHFLRAHH